MKKIIAIILGITMILGTSMFVSAEEIESHNTLSEYNYSGSKANAQGLQEQYQCHVNFAAAKNPWNLEPWRSAVGYIETTKKGCNP